MGHTPATTETEGRVTPEKGDTGSTCLCPLFTLNPTMTFDRTHFYDTIRARLYPKVGLKQAQVDGLNWLLEHFEQDDRMSDVRWVAYALATTKRETGDEYEPIAEKGPRSYFAKYDFRRDLGHNAVGMGWKWRGRGYPQCTGLRNYTLFSRILGIDLVNDPDQMLDRNVAYQTMVIGMTQGLFTGRKLADYINDKKCDYVGARWIINSQDKAVLIADHATIFETALRAA